jgi:tetratricopeptide (TPR) repeat protein
MLRIAGCALLTAAFAPTMALAQTYPAANPVARTTAPAQLDALARDREVAEGFRRGLDADAHADWKTSAAEFARVVSLDPPEPRGSTAQYDLGIARAHLGQYAAAETAFGGALKRDRGFAAAAANLVDTALRAGDFTLARSAADFTLARSAADQFYAIAPTSLRARYSRGLVALQQNDLATARTDFAALSAAAPTYALAHYDLAVTEMRAGDYIAAQTELQAALALSPNYARARFALATLLLRSDYRAEASANLARVIQDADDPSLRALAMSLRDRVNGAPQ